VVDQIGEHSLLEEDRTLLFAHRAHGGDIPVAAAPADDFGELPRVGAVELRIRGIAHEVFGEQIKRAGRQSARVRIEELEDLTDAFRRRGARREIRDGPIRRSVVVRASDGGRAQQESR
jgi:hypothetical protein